MHSKTSFQSICAFWAAKTRSKRTKTVENIGKTHENSPFDTKMSAETIAFCLETPSNPPVNQSKYSTIRRSMTFYIQESNHAEFSHESIRPSDRFPAKNRQTNPLDTSPKQLSSENVKSQIGIEVSFGSMLSPHSRDRFSVHQCAQSIGFRQ